MRVRADFTTFIATNTGNSKPEIKETPSPAKSDAEQFMPALVENTANYYGQLNTTMSDQEVDALKESGRELLEKHGEALEGFMDIAQGSCPDGLPVHYKAGPKPGLFSVEICEGNLGSSSSLYGGALGTLFVDTTPGKDGIQSYYNSNT